MDNHDDDQFFDAVEKQPIETLDSPTIFDHDTLEDVETYDEHATESPLITGIGRRHGGTRRTIYGERRSKIVLSGNGSGDRNSAVTFDRQDEGLVELGDAESVRRSTSCLEFFAGFVIRAVFFQLNLLINCFNFPIWLMHCCLSAVSDPFGTLKLAIDGLRVRAFRVYDGLLGRFGFPMSESLGRHHGMGKLVTGVAWVCLWSFYVCVVLSGLLAFAFLAASVIMGRVVEEPVQITSQLSFDYTKAKPDAFAPIGACHGLFSSGDKVRVENSDRWWQVPANHKLEVAVSLILPESDYNKRLGVFQVRVEFLSADSRVLFMSSQPCMLRFKSSHMYLLETFMRSVFLLSGYSSEAQIVKVKMEGFSEGTEPIVCLRVIIEQRAEFRTGAGIPEIYSASLKLESQLPLFKQMIWNWRRTLLMWITMLLFILELLIVLVCCRPVIIPSPRSSGGSPRPL